MIAYAPPTEHRSEARLILAADGVYDLAIGTAEFGNGAAPVHGQIAAGALNTTLGRVRITYADTDRTGYDTGAFASTGTTVAGKAVALTADALRERLLAFAAEHTGAAVGACRLKGDAVVCDGRRIGLAELHAAARQAGRERAAMRKAGNSPRSIVFNVHGFRIAVCFHSLPLAPDHIYRDISARFADDAGPADPA